MRITHLCLAGTITDGWTYQENLITKYHKKMGHDVSIITSNWIYDANYKPLKSLENDYINSDGVHVIRLQIKNKDSLSYKFKRYSGIEQSLDTLNPDVLFIHGCQFLDIDVIVKYLKNHNSIRVYIDNHADFSNSATNPISRYLLHGIIWKKRANLIEPYVKKFYGVLPARVNFLINVYHLPKEKVELLVMGVDDDIAKVSLSKETKMKTRKKYGINDKDLLVVSGGKIDKAKWQTLLLMDAFKNINIENAKLVIFGPVIEELKTDVIEKCNDHIQYIGWLDSKDSTDLFAAADLVVFPGRHSVFWEQVAGMGIPMVCKHWEGTTHIDVGGNAAFLYEDSEKEIESCLKKILGNEHELKNMKEVAINKAAKVFSYQEIAKKSIDS